VANRKYRKLFATGAEEIIGLDKKSAGSDLAHRSKRYFQIGVGACVKDVELESEFASRG
jgi:hypothetical protein